MRRLLLAFTFALAVTTAAHADQPITTDSRIKTLVYNANEVFNITTHYGYQSNIEFGDKETIETISMGDRVAWQVSPAGRRLFIRAQEENAHTNMTVITNQRAYQFDLRSSSADAVFGSEELTYVVRFYYPEDAAKGIPMPTPAPVVRAAPTPVVASAPLAPAVAIPPATTPAVLAPIPTGSLSAVAPVKPLFNYRYTYSGSNAIAPLKIFDDGKTTYFKFPANVVPQIAVLSARGEALPVEARRTSDGLVAVSAVAPRFSLLQAQEQVIVYNEAGGVL